MYYKTKIPEILNDETNYTQLDTNIGNNIIKITKFCKMQNISQTKEKYFLTNYIPKTSNFYELPKIHKFKQIKKKRRNTKVQIYRISKTQ